jgi:hypothetical protein
MSVEAIELSIKIIVSVVLTIVGMFILLEHILFRSIGNDTRVCKRCEQPYRLIYRKKNKVDVWQMRSSMRNPKCICHKFTQQ